MTARPVVGVFPAPSCNSHALLLDALATVLDLEFRAVGDAGDPEADGYLAFGRPSVTFAPRPVFCYAVGASGGVVERVAYRDTPELDPRLRGRVLPERRARRTEAPLGDAAVLATDESGDPLWVRTVDATGRVVERVAVAPPSLRAGESLRDHLGPSGHLALLPLVHFLRGLAGEHAWRDPPLRAAFVIDDPNLHWRSYGPVHYETLVRHADEWDYHIAMAMIPLDVWFTHAATARLFRERRDRLSLVVHGNNHPRNELGRPQSEPEALGLAAHALRRVEAFERRSGLRVSRVMVPPHEACTPLMLRALMRLGFDGASMTRPHPWIPTSLQVSPYATTPDDLDAGWFPAELRCDGFPILIRRGLRQLEEVFFRAWLGQPVLLYAHVSDLAGDLHLLEEAAGEISRAGDVQWCSFEQISETNYRRLRTGSLLRVMPFARRFKIGELEDLEALQVEWRMATSATARLEWRSDAGRKEIAHSPNGEGPIPIPPAATSVEVTLIDDEAISADAVGRARTPPGLVARRVMTEARDRLAHLWTSEP